MMIPTTNDNPFRYVSVLFRSNEPSAIPSCRPSAEGVPKGAYPPAVCDSGKRALPKSKAEEMEYDRADLGRPESRFACECELDRGSSSSRESLREEEMPEGEDEAEDLPADSGEEDAREASSRESRGAWRLSDLVSV